jgi:thioredoxin-like negative regulator of GroEL
MLTPIFKRLSSEFVGKMKFVTINVVVDPTLAQSWGIMGVPTIKFFCARRPVYEIVGFRNERDLRLEFEKVIETHRDYLSKSSPIYV